MSNKKLLIRLLPYLLISLLVAFSYRGVINNFFEQDEWAVMADMIVFHALPLDQKLRIMFSSSGMFSHFIPLTTAASYVVNRIFGINFQLYAILNLALHILVVLSVYKFSYLLTQKKSISIASSLLFGVHNLTSQVVTWIAAGMGAELSTLFLLFSFISYFTYLSNKKSISLAASVAFFICSLLFKETSITLIVVFPLLYLLKVYKKGFKLKFDKEIKKTLLYPLCVFGYFLTKLFFSYILPHHAPTTIGGPSEVSILPIAFKLLLYPFLALSQIYDLGGWIFNSSSLILSSLYPSLANVPSAPKIYEFVVSDLLYIFASFVILVGFFVVALLIKSRERRVFYLILFLLTCFFVSVIPYVPLPRFSSFLEPRYYYVPHIFSSILLAVCLYILALLVFKKKFLFPFALAVCILFAINNMYLVKTIKGKNAIAAKRKMILSQLSNQLPTLTNDRNIFYVTGRGEDYLIPHLKVPFQSGFGNVLMMLYFPSQKIPAELTEGGFLYQLDDQGYKESEGKGFGYYYDKDTLQKDIKSSKISVKDIKVVFYDQQKGTVKLNSYED